jgi:hypothetical protein
VTETNVFQLSQPGAFADPLAKVLHNGTRALLAGLSKPRLHPCTTCMLTS